MISSFLRHTFSRLGKHKYLLIRLLIFSIFILSIIYLLNFSPNAFLKHYFHSILLSEHSISAEYLNEFHKLNPVISGWGEEGQPVYLSEHDMSIAKKQFSSAAFNVFISDRIRF